MIKKFRLVVASEEGGRKREERRNVIREGYTSHIQVLVMVYIFKSNVKQIDNFRIV